MANYHQAKIDAAAALALDPTFTDGLIASGIAKLKLEMFDAALRDFISAKRHNYVGIEELINKVKFDQNRSKNYYELLNVERTARSDEINRAFKKLVTKYHTDKTVGKSPEEIFDGLVMFRWITNAKDTLLDSNQIKIFDQTLCSGAASGSRPMPPPASTRPRPKTS